MSPAGMSVIMGQGQFVREVCKRKGQFFILKTTVMKIQISPEQTIGAV